MVPGCLRYIGDEILPFYMGIIVNHYKDPYEATNIMESKRILGGLMFWLKRKSIKSTWRAESLPQIFLVHIGTPLEFNIFNMD